MELTDPYEKIELLNDLINFYLRHCNKESEHFNIIANKIIEKYKPIIPVEVLEERNQRKTDYNYLRLQFAKIVKIDSPEKLKA